MDETYASRLEVTWASSQGFTARGLDLAMGILNMTVRDPPPGYDAAVYAIGLEVEGRPTMALYYQQAGAARRYMCAPDTLLFARPPTNPLDTDFLSVSGNISFNPKSGVGSIRMEIPPECLGMPGFGETHEASRFGAATFLVQRLPDGSSRLTKADDVYVDQPFLLAAATATSKESSAPATAWYAAPFGVDNFWDMLGIVAAVAMSGGAVAVVQRKRGALKRYLNEIEAAVQEHTLDPKAQEDALLDLRPHVKEALLHGRLSEGHYAIVERRLEDELSRARVTTLLETFGELPHRLIVRLQDLLKDGVLSLRDYRHFSAALHGTGLKKSAIDNVQRKLREWVAQDHR